MTHILVLNGPNLNLLGQREPEVYGHDTLASIEQDLLALATLWGWTCSFIQSNHEGVLIDSVHQYLNTTQGIIINPGGLTHTSVALRDALACYPKPIIEVHLSQIHQREAFRHHSYISGVASAVLCGFGAYGYTMALLALKQKLSVG